MHFHYCKKNILESLKKIVQVTPSLPGCEVIKFSLIVSFLAAANLIVLRSASLLLVCEDVSQLCSLRSAVIWKQLKLKNNEKKIVMSCLKIA